MRNEEHLCESPFLTAMYRRIHAPVNYIMVMSDLILHKDIPQDVHQLVSIIKQSGSDILASVNEMIDYSKIDLGQIEMVSEGYSLTSLINDISNTINAKLLNSAVEFSLRVDAGIPDVLVGDKARLRQILKNLLDNAKKYTIEGYITLDIHYQLLDDNRIRLIFIISDSGIGVNTEAQAKLFTSYVRSEDLKICADEGTGLGLTIAKGLCRAMNGDITLNSEYGVGSVFIATVIQGYRNEARKATVWSSAHTF